MFFKSPEDKMVSIDIETSGLDKKKDWIWSLGTSRSGKEHEFFVNNAEPGKIESLLDPKNDIFGIEGYFDPYKKALAEGTAMPKAEAIESMFQQIDKESVVLIQNINFENTRIAESINGEEAAKFADKFKFVTKDHGGHLFYRPPEVTKALHEAGRHSMLMMGAQTEEDANAALQNVNKSYKKMISQYDKAIGSKSGAVTVDLMDMTKATFAAAAQRNIIGKSHIETGLSVDFLSKVLISKEERHTAAADATFQNEIFGKLGKMYNELESGSMSEETTKNFAKIKAAQPFESSRVFLSSLRNRLQEIQRDGSTALLDQSKLRIVEREISGVKHSFMETDYSNVKTTSSPKDATAHLVEKYSKRNTGGLDIKQYSSSLEGLNLDEQISKIESDHATFKQKVATRIQGTATISERVTDAYRGMPKINKKYGIAAVALGAAYLATGGGEQDEEKNYEAMDKQMSYQRSNEKTFKMFSEPKVHHGTGLYLWENAVGHHQY